MKKIISLSVAFALLLTAVSCSNGTDKFKNQKIQQNYTAEKLSNIAAYRKENIMLPSEMRQIYTFMPYNNSNEYLLLGTGTKTPEFWKVNDDFTEFETVEFPEFDIGKTYDLDASNDGTVTLFVNHVDYGDLPPISLYEYPEDYDEAKYDAVAEYKFMIKTFNMNGELISSADVTGYGGIAEKSSMINGVSTDGNIVIVGLSGTSEIFNTDGTYIGELTTDEGDIDTIGKDKDGKLICTVAYKENETDKLKICYINPDGTLSDYNNTTYDFLETPQGIQQGTGDYSLFLYSRSTIFGIRSDNAEIVPLLNINVSGTSSDSIKGFMLMSDDNIALMSNNYKEYSVNFKKYIPRTAEEMEGIPVLTYGVCSGAEQEQYYTSDINDWNDEGHDFMLELKFYTINWNDESIVFDEIQQDALSGNLPDIMKTDNGSFGELNLAEKGAFYDLYEFMDNDKTFTRDYFVPNVLKCLETDGKLYSLPNRFMVELGDMAKTKFVGSAEDWSLEKYVDVTVNPPIDIEIDYDSKQRRFDMISFTDWIDMKTATCNYTDETFIKFLNWCNEADALESVYPTFEEYENMSDEESEANYIEQQRRYIDDKAIFTGHSLMSYENYVRDTRGEFGGEPITYLEEPTISSWDELSISADSEYKEFAWEYIKSRCTDEFYTIGMSDNSFTGPFPITKTGLKYYENFERTHYTDDSKQRRFDMISFTDWIDMKTATCNYTDETFIKFLNWCNEADALESVYPTFEEYENMSDEESEANYIEQQRRYIDDKAIFTGHSLMSYENYVRDTRGEFGGEPITYLEEPTISSWDELSISADSEYKEFAWEYIKSRCTDEFYTIGMSDNSFTGPFPITKTGLKYYENFERTHYTDYTKYDETKDDPKWKDYKGIVYQLSSSIYHDAIQCGEITDEDVAIVNEFITNAKPKKQYLQFTEEYYNIINEETDRFFNGGYTAEQCADAIQSRVSIYLSERFG
ncbi:MAG: hypothetical protein K2H19_10085 [Ruminococcus sp.]|nr:hypothetical protein [Ruminococcus sp.]